MRNFDIEKYINGEMTEEELEAFDRQLKLDPDLQAEVHQTRELIKDLRRIGLSEKIQQAQQNNRRLKWIKWIAIAGLISVGILYFSTINFTSDSGLHPAKTILIPEQVDKILLPEDSLQNNSKQPIRDSLPKQQETLPKETPIFAWQDPGSAREMADFYFSTPEDFSYVRGGSTESLLDSAKMEFNLEAYSKALDYLHKLTNVSFEKPYFQAICYFRLGKYTDAGNLFKLSLSQSPDPQKTMDIEWYSFLNALACGKPCNKEFTRLSQSIQKDEASLLKAGQIDFKKEDQNSPAN
ncbi:MAG: hypothetical protein IPM92_14535 [Saprospiraceae bacterium]|nr:hypothetical protein [Saprospiraceae bacterium]